MSNGSPQPGTDLSTEQVKLMLSIQGYSVPDAELIEITVSLNALVEGLVQLEQFGSLENEPWPTLVQFGGSDAR